MSDETITFLVLGATVVVFIWDRLPVAIVAVGVALSLWATGVLELEQALAGFGDPTVIFIASLFVVSEALDATGVTTWAGQQLISRTGESRTRVLVLMVLLCAVLTALITVNGSVAALLLQGTWGALDKHLDDPDVVVIDHPALVRRQAVPLGAGKRALAALAAMVILLATGAVPPAVAGLLAAGALVVSAVLSIEQAYRGISWTTVILVAGMIPLSTAMGESGAAERLANGLVDVVGESGLGSFSSGLSCSSSCSAS